jgi:NAD(P)-dependent dehydrogenase (short-subunit alcohol dehydrogenase family)
MDKPQGMMAGKVVIVTGATAGIGKEIARGLARLGATMVIGARDAGRGRAVADEIVKDAGHANVSVLEIDVACLAKVRDFAAAFESKFDRLDALVNNAGAWFTDRRLSPDGYEMTFATNVLGPHLLARLLLPRLKSAGSSRVVNIVSSMASDYDADDLMYEKRKYDGFKAYGQSKQAFRMLTWGLAKQLEGTGVTANAAAPGFVRTEFNRNARGFMATMINLSSLLFAVSPEKGADTPIWVASAPELATSNGKLFDARKEKDGKFREPAPIADLERRCDEYVSRGGTQQPAA